MRRLLAIAVAATVVFAGAVGATGPLSPAQADDPWGTGIVQGHVSVPQGIDATKYWVQIDTADQKLSYGSSNLTASGEFEVKLVKTGQYRATVREKNGDTVLSYQTLRTTAGPSTFSVTDGQSTDVSFTLQAPAASISGTIDVVGYDRLVIATSELVDGEWLRWDNTYDGSGESPVSYTTPKLTAGTHAVYIYAEDAVLPSESFYYGNSAAWGEPSPIAVGATNLTGINYVIPRSFAAPNPVVAGTPRVGATLTANIGAWQPAPESLSYQWMQRSGDMSEAISGATGASYVPTAADVGKQLELLVIGTKTGYRQKYVYSDPTAAVDAGALTAPQPTISGTSQVGKTLTAIPGVWGPSPVALKYQWLLDGSAISGATTDKYQPVVADAGKKLSVRVTGSKTAYASEARTSAETAAIAKSGYVAPSVSPFSDLTPSSKFYKEISWMFDTGVSTGVRQSDGSRHYQPKNKVTRQAMAAFLYRISDVKGYVAPETSPFQDVKPGDSYYKEISWMFDSGLSTGVKLADGTRVYQPKGGVSRQAMAAFMYRLDESQKPAAPSASPFRDVAVGQKFYKEITWMYSSGLSTGVKQPSGKPKYAPAGMMTRETMAAFLFRADR